MNDPVESSMAEARQKAFSTSLTIEVGTRVEMIARRENRSYANVIMYHDAMRRLDEAAEAVAKHIRIPPDPRDYDDAVVVERGS
jgi:hypothetical protein